NSIARAHGTAAASATAETNEVKAIFNMRDSVIQPRQNAVPKIHGGKDENRWRRVEGLGSRRRGEASPALPRRITSADHAGTCDRPGPSPSWRWPEPAAPSAALAARSLAPA